MSEEEKNIQGQVFESGSNFHTREYNSLDFEYDAEFKEPTQKPKLCIFCNAPWTPRMESIYISMGYCETCYDSESLNVLVCDSCNRIVYRK